MTSNLNEMLQQSGHYMLYEAGFAIHMLLGNMAHLEGFLDYHKILKCS
jgi:hypothetical protein